MIRQNLIQKKLEEVFKPILLEVEDESHQHSGRGVGTHFRVVMVSEGLANLSRVEREQKVQGLFNEERKLGLHALSVRLYTPAEWSKLKSQPEASPTCTGQKIKS